MKFEVKFCSKYKELKNSEHIFLIKIKNFSFVAYFDQILKN